MEDYEKTIKGLTHCLARYVDGLCDDCPFMGALDKSYMIPMKCEEIVYEQNFCYECGCLIDWATD